MEEGKKPLAGDTTHEATSDEELELRKENKHLKEIVADLVLRYYCKKNLGHFGLTDKFKKSNRLHIF